MPHRVLALAVLALIAILTVAACDDAASSSDAPGAYTVSATEAVDLIASGQRTVIDVRTPDEFAAGHIAGAINYDVNGAAFSEQIAELDADTPLLVYCRSGNRSAQAAAQMEDAGILDIADAGGLADLAAAGAPVE